MFLKYKNYFNSSQGMENLRNDLIRLRAETKCLRCGDGKIRFTFDFLNKLL